MTAVLILAVVYALGLCGQVALVVWLLRTDVWFGTMARINPRGVALAGAVWAVAWPAVVIAVVLIRWAESRS
ncbi:hypothetical protein [Embleya scabrispora]|uniref:hypothetical protein n=1 Tax=Embleya scabrispora TaxID=159449 RepID=UPI001F3309AC|nr:hypothetical protein [Embleya scabrispora]